MASAADVVAPLFLYAAGYHVPENYVLVAQRGDFQLSPKAMVTEASGKKHPMSRMQLKRILDKVPVTPDGHLRYPVEAGPSFQVGRAIPRSVAHGVENRWASQTWSFPKAA